MLCFWKVCLQNYDSRYYFSELNSMIVKQEFLAASFALPISLVVPVLISGLVIFCGYYAKSTCIYDGTIPLYLFFNSPPLVYLSDFVGGQHIWLWLFWLLSQVSPVIS